MDVSKLYYQDLLSRFIRDDLSAAEAETLFNMMSEEPGIYSELLEDNGLQMSIEQITKEYLVTMPADADQRVREKLRAHAVVTHQHAVTHRVHFLKTAWLRYAAAIILLFGVGAYLWNSYKTHTKENNATIIPSSHDILPGGQKAILVLADGREIILDNAANGAIAQQGNSSIIKHNNGEIVYNFGGAANDEVMINTMRTPRGGQYQITLPDGSRAWLNAASSITYPAAFIGKERKIKVTGEVYLEIAKNKSKPFIVDVDGQSSVEVLGTSFNINAYNNEENIHTTLLEGSIKVNGTILKRGQQAIVGPESIRVQPVNIEKVIAWKNGLFNFNDLRFEEIMRQLERWYDIEVVYENNNIPNRRLAGEMTRGVSLNGLLKQLGKMGMRYKLDNRKLIVFP